MPKKSFFYLNNTLSPNFHSGCVCVRARAIDVMMGLVCWRRKRNIRVVSLWCDFYSRNREYSLLSYFPTPVRQQIYHYIKKKQLQCTQFY